MTNLPRPLVELTADEARGLTGLVFDLDDTVLDHGELTEAAYSALFRLRESGLRLIACTGRPAGWAEVLLRQWPMDAAVAENGAVALVKKRQVDRAAALVKLFPTNDMETRDRRLALLEMARSLVARFPEAALADDNDARWTDVTIDIGEHKKVGAETIARMRNEVVQQGIATFVSSVHMHLVSTAGDKASGTLRLFESWFGESSEVATRANAFVGDSGNDAAAFSAFHLTFGVANVINHLPQLPNPPKFMTKNSRGLGFAELSERLVCLRTSGSK